MGYFWGWGNRVQYLVVGTDGRVRRTVDIPLPGAPMIHDMAITERYALVFDQPCLLNHAAAVAGAPLPYRWDPDYTPRIGLLPREGGAEDIVWIETASCYVFHPMNAFDDADGCVQVDVVRHPRMFATEQRGPMEGRPVLERWTLDPARRGFRATRMDERPVEFPRIDERLTGLPYRYGYASMPGRGFAQRAIVRYDMQSGASELRDEGEGKGFGEPVFVPRHASAAEDEGWVMALRLERAADRSDLVILDAADIGGEPVATVHLPVRVPAGFHGSWCADG
jgi:carotenoid cleavage dioxygenase